jgi:hypothetical protein
LAFDRLDYGNVKADSGRLTLVNKDRVARVTIERARYTKAAGIITFDSTTIEANLAADGVSVLPLLRSTRQATIGWRERGI